jgi:hypothetical protein
MMKNKLSEAQGQYFFWEPVNKDIPETELSRPRATLNFARSHRVLTILRPVTSVQSAVLNRFRNVFHRNVLFTSKIRYRPCYLQDTVMRPCTQALLLHRPLEQPLRIRRKLTISPYLLRIHLRIGKYLPRSSLR